jgi:cysteine desulfurase/selenocysteine lyase
MNTSEQDKAGNAWPHSGEAMNAGTMPDVAMLTQLANEFFRALPGQVSSPVAAQPALAAFLPDVRSCAPSLASAPNFDTRLPQFGAAAPAVPATLSVDKLPGEAGAQRMTGAPSFMPNEAMAFRPFAAMPVMESAFPQQGMPQHSDTMSPFSLPLPSFDAMFPSFESGIPAIPLLPVLPTEDAAKAALTTASSFYFLENAGGCRSPLL